ncbi:hypothetical protein N9U71_03295 [Candidatus Pelagibacter sp.]|nr:hypothetical protein [Candidatus Pelagibacter sp.]|tara:strand:+ start:48 stop:635 length:588 start_codon:yes stop_codon:yes gene_type:complete
MNNLDEDSLVFSVTYENYIKNIKQDKQNKTLGEWSIKDDKINTLKYAYVYLVGSNQMVVKKYYIEKFEKSDPSKGYMDPDKKCFIFSKSEDLFVDFPLVVQGRQYVNSSTLDNAQKISPDQVNVRMMNAKESKSEGTKSKVKTLSARDKLVEVKNTLFKDKVFKDFSVISSLEKQVEDGKSAEEVLTNYFDSLNK